MSVGDRFPTRAGVSPSKHASSSRHSGPRHLNSTSSSAGARDPTRLDVTYTEAMGAYQASVDFEPAIWARLIQAPKAPIAPDAALYLLSIDFNEQDHARMHELMDKSNEGALTADGMAELDGYVNIANVLSVMHAQARAALRKSGFEPSLATRNT
jgi:hypothetical protein